jgi:GPH family glycoside/pentoside/hexuronide:cation symporter
LARVNIHAVAANPMTTQAHINERDRIPFLQKLMFSLGINMDYVATGLITGVLWMPFFNIGLGMSPTVLGIILMVLRFWDAMTNPVIGNLSDNARTRWGRRRPFMFVGAITTAAIYPLFWYIPAGLGDTGRIVYLTVIGLVFFTSFTVWSMPYYSLQMELTPDYDERTRLTAWMTFFGKGSFLVGSWILAFVILLGGVALNQPAVFEGHDGFAGSLLRWLQPLLAVFGSNAADEKPVVVGMRICSWFIALGILVFGLLPAIFVKERPLPAVIGKKDREPFWQSVRDSARSMPLWSLISISFFLVLGSTAVGSLGQYLNIYYVFHGDLGAAAYVAGWKGSVLVTAGIISIPFFTWLGEKWDKRTVVLVMLGVSMAGHFLNLFMMTPEHPYWQLIPGVTESCGIAAIWLFLPSMKADVADADELKTGRRREGSINSFFSWFLKLAFTASMGIGGVLLELSGFDAKINDQPPEVLHRMMWLYIALPTVIWGIAMVSCWYFPLGRKKCAEIRAELEARRGQR